MNYNVKERMLKFLASIKKGQTAFEEEVGLSRGLVSKIRNGISKNSIQKIQQAYPGLNITWLLTGEGDMITGSIPQSHKDPETQEDFTQRTLADLAASNKMLAEANIILARSHEQLLSKWTNRPDDVITAGAGQENDVAYLSRLSDLLEVMAEIGSGKRWGSKEEARAALRIFLTVPQKNK